jgi:predicted nuclease with TOPRIM domain
LLTDCATLVFAGTREDTCPMAIDHLLEQLLDRIRHDPDLRRQLAQLLFGRELAQLADQLAQLASLSRSLAESTQQGFQLLAERSSLVERELATLRRVVGELAEQQRATTAQIAALTERMERVEGQIAALTERMERVEGQIAALTERMERVEGQIAALTERMERVEGQIAALTERMERVEQQQTATTEQIRQLTERMERVEQQQAATTAQIQLLAAQVSELVEMTRRHEDSIGQLRGWYLESKARDRAPAVFGPWLERVRLAPVDEIRRRVLPVLGKEGLRRILAADVIVSGRADDLPNAPTVWLVVEVSAVVDPSDVARALERAALLRQVTENVIPVVWGPQLTEEARYLAEEQALVVVRDGALEGWEAALQRWVATG